jgi:predicted phosphohydrolase
MKIQLLSDLHLEFYDNKKHYNEFIKIFDDTIKNKENIDILILAGDICYPKLSIFDEFIDYVSKIYSYILYLSGNHEYYTDSIENVNNILEEKLNRYPNIHFMNNKVIEINNIRFIGSTLWSNIQNNSYEINDIKFIKKNNKNIKAEDITKLFFENYNFIKNNINDINDKCIIITHHLPSYKCINPIYKNSLYNSWFASDCEDLMNSNIKYWFCGHTHSNVNIKINGTHIIANPLGYPTFQFNKIIFENNKYESMIIDI